MSKKTIVVIIFSAIALACMIGAGIVIGVFFNSNNDLARFSNIFSNGAEVDETKQLDLEGISSLAIDCVSGTIDIVPADTARVELKGQIWNRQTQETYLDIYEKDGTLTVKFDLENKFFNFFNEDMRMTIYLPEKSMLNMNILSASGDINMTNMQFGDVTILSTSGDTQIDDCMGASLDIDKASGDTDISSADFESINIVCISGDINIIGTPAAIDIRSTSGDIEIKDVSAALRIGSISGSVTAKILGTDIEPIDIDITSGNAKLYLNEDAAFDLKAKATSGNIKTDFDISISGKVLSSFISDNVTGKCNGGGAQIDINTVSGDISIMKE